MSFFATLLFLILPVGESLHYTIHYGPFQVGTLDLMIKEMALIQEESCYHLVARLKSYPQYRFLFRIDDQLESYARCSDFATLKSIKRVLESGYQNLSQAEFDYSKMKVFYSDSGVFDIVPRTKDLLSTWYYFRTLNLKPNDTITVSVHMDKKNYQVEVVTVGPRDVSTKIGKMECLLVQPKLARQQDIGTVYLTNDEQKIPAMIKKRFAFGNIVAVLTRIGG
ncbi:MAG: DUF3108 domain-containing protein [candidate division WOR-3 bacterium]